MLATFRICRHTNNTGSRKHASRDGSQPKRDRYYLRWVWFRLSVIGSNPGLGSEWCGQFFGQAGFCQHIEATAGTSGRHRARLRCRISRRIQILRSCCGTMNRQTWLDANKIFSLKEMTGYISLEAKTEYIIKLRFLW